MPWNKSTQSDSSSDSWDSWVLASQGSGHSLLRNSPRGPMHHLDDTICQNISQFFFVPRLHHLDYATCPHFCFVFLCFPFTSLDGSDAGRKKNQYTFCDFAVVYRLAATRAAILTSYIRHKDILLLRPSRSGNPPCILKRAGLESSGWFAYS